MIERWEIFQANSNDEDEDGVQQDQCKLTSDIRELTSCLDCVLPELERLQRGTESPSVRDMENSICKLQGKSEDVQ